MTPSATTERLRGVPGEPSPDPAGWPTLRWATVLDRMELRQEGIGLRFWGPPLWLEVTMVGPDSDLWPLEGDPDQEWNWQSSRPCTEAAELAAAGAGDGRVLEAVSRYTFDNLILNAVHEIGEWFRLDGRRVFPAHPAPGPGAPVLDVDGNGAVRLEVRPHPSGPGSSVVASPPPGLAPWALDRLAGAVSAARFTYLPATSISFEAAGVVVSRWDAAETPWRSPWSSETHALVEGGDQAELVDVITCDVHRALVEHEADRVCRSFHVDGQPVWTLGPGRSSDRSSTGGVTGHGLLPVALGLTYSAGALSVAAVAEPLVDLARPPDAAHLPPGHPGIR